MTSSHSGLVNTNKTKFPVFRGNQTAIDRLNIKSKMYVISSPENHNRSTDMTEMVNNSGFFLGLAVAGFTLSAVTAIGNSVLLFTIFSNSRHLLRTPPSLLLTNLCVSDLLVGLIVGDLVAVKDVYRYLNLPVPEKLDPILRLVLGLTLFVSSGTIIAMSCDRYVAVVRPFRYRTTITKKRIKLFIAVMWVLSLALCFLPLTSVPEETFKLIYAHTHASLPAVLLTVIYIKVFRALAKRKRELKLVGINRATFSKQALERERRMVVTILIILVMFYITVLPEFVALHVFHFCSFCRQSPTLKQLEIVFSRFLFLNSAVNPVIYAWRVPKYRRAFIDCLAGLRQGHQRLSIDSRNKPRQMPNITRANRPAIVFGLSPGSRV